MKSEPESASLPSSRQSRSPLPSLPDPRAAGPMASAVRLPRPAGLPSPSVHKSSVPKRPSSHRWPFSTPHITSCQRYNLRMAIVSRREFFGATAAAVLTTARSYSEIKGANERLRVGVIGCGGQAMGHMRALKKNKENDNVETIAVCDIYDKRLAQAAELTGGKPYKNYHDLLANKDIDYVLVATPEHWHSQMTLDVADAGKHIYCEKPMTRTVEQAKRVVAK